MAKNTGAPKLAPKNPMETLRRMTYSELWDIISDNDYDDAYRKMAVSVTADKKEGLI